MDAGSDRLVDVFDLDDWALALLMRARVFTATDAVARSANGRYGFTEGVRPVEVCRLATMLWDFSAFSRPFADCVKAAKVVYKAAGKRGASACP